MDFAGYKYVTTLVVLAEIGVLFLTYKRNPKLAFYAIVISILLKGQYLWIGRAIYAWQIAALLGLAYLAMGRDRGIVQIAGRELSFFRMSMLLYFIYTVAVSVPMWLIFHVEGLGDFGTEVSVNRVMTQTVYFLFLVGIFGIGIWAGRHLNTIDLLRAIILIAIVAAYGAILQSLIVHFVGINIFPIIGSDSTIRSAFILDRTFRANSFVGEPKHLGLLMSIGLISFFLTRLFRIKTGGRFAIHKPLAMVVALLLSLSTTGIVITAGGIGVITVIFFRWLRSTDLAMVSLLAVVVVGQVIGSGGDYADSLERQISKTNFEVQDESVKQALLARPDMLVTGTGLGNIHLIAVDYLPTNFPLFRNQGYKANSGLYFVMGDSGLVGLLLLLSGPLFCIQACARLRRYQTPDDRKEALSTLALILVTLFSFMLRHDPGYFLFAGFVFTRLSVLRQQTTRTRNTHSSEFAFQSAER